MDFSNPVEGDGDRRQGLEDKGTQDSGFQDKESTPSTSSSSSGETFVAPDSSQVPKKSLFVTSFPPQMSIGFQDIEDEDYKLQSEIEVEYANFGIGSFAKEYIQLNLQQEEEANTEQEPEAAEVNHQEVQDKENLSVPNVSQLLKEFEFWDEHETQDEVASGHKGNQVDQVMEAVSGNIPTDDSLFPESKASNIESTLSSMHSLSSEAIPIIGDNNKVDQVSPPREQTSVSTKNDSASSLQDMPLGSPENPIDLTDDDVEVLDPVLKHPVYSPFVVTRTKKSPASQSGFSPLSKMPENDRRKQMQPKKQQTAKKSSGKLTAKKSASSRIPTSAARSKNKKNDSQSIGSQKFMENWLGLPSKSGVGKGKAGLVSRNNRDTTFFPPSPSTASCSGESCPPPSPSPSSISTQSSLSRMATEVEHMLIHLDPEDCVSMDFEGETAPPVQQKRSNKRRSAPKKAPQPKPQEKEQEKFPQYKSNLTVMQEIKLYQNSTGFLIHPIALRKHVIKTCAQYCIVKYKGNATAVKFQVSAMNALQTAVEEFLTEMFEGSLQLANHAKRVTVMPKDFRLHERFVRQYCRKINFNSLAMNRF